MHLGLSSLFPFLAGEPPAGGVGPLSRGLFPPPPEPPPPSLLTLEQSNSIVRNLDF